MTAPQRAIARGQQLKKELKFKLNLEAFSCVIWAFPQIPQVNWSETSRESRTSPSAANFFPSCKSITPLCNQRRLRNVLQTVIFQWHQSMRSDPFSNFPKRRFHSWEKLQPDTVNRPQRNYAMLQSIIHLWYIFHLALERGLYAMMNALPRMQFVCKITED